MAAPSHHTKRKKKQRKKNTHKTTNHTKTDKTNRQDRQDNKQNQKRQDKQTRQQTKQKEAKQNTQGQTRNTKQTKASEVWWWGGGGPLRKRLQGRPWVCVRMYIHIHSCTKCAAHKHKIHQAMTRPSITNFLASHRYRNVSRPNTSEHSSGALIPAMHKIKRTMTMYRDGNILHRAA